MTLQAKGFQGETRKPLKDSIVFTDAETSIKFKKEVAGILSNINIPITLTFMLAVSSRKFMFFAFAKRSEPFAFINIVPVVFI